MQTRPMPPTLGLRRLACVLCGVIVASLSVIACGDAKPGVVVAWVDGHSIAKAELERWTAIEAVLAYETNPGKPVPSGVVPDPPAYVKCIAHLETSESTGEVAPTRAQLKRRCAEKRELLRRHILDILITYYWLSGDAAERGVKVTNTEIRQVLDRIFPSAAAYRRYLSITRERPSDERLIIEKDLFDSKLLQLSEAQSKRKPTSMHQRERALIQAATAFTQKWKARTSCSAGYIVAECRQYKGPLSLIEP
jgi:hypothetical protein